MAEVVGNIGSESVRLRGMALEYTQQSILRTLDEIEENTRSQLSEAKRRARADKSGALVEQLRQNTNAHIQSRKRDAKDRTTFWEGLKKADGKLNDLLDGSVMRTIRGFDSNIQSSSFALRQFASSNRNLLGTFAKFSADSVDQLQEQFDVYKKLRVVGGATADDFSTLRETAAKMGLTMQEYVGIIQDNFTNLRLGGGNVRKSMQGLSRTVEEMRNNGGGIADQFIDLGVSAHDYGKIILQNTALMGGLNKAQEKYGPNFANQMLIMTKRSQEVAEAFGINRDQLMEASKKAMDDATFANIYDSLKESLGEKGGQALDVALQEFIAFTRGDEGKAKSLLLAAYTGVYNDQASALISLRGDLFQKFQEYSRAVVGGTMTADQARRQILAPMAESVQAQNKIIENNLPYMTDAVDANQREMKQYIDHFGRTFFTDRNSIINQSANAAKSASQLQLESFGRIQRVNIDLAVQFAKLNQIMNEFGLGVANVFQILTMSGLILAKQSIEELKNDPMYQDLMKMIDDAKGGLGRMNNILSPETTENLRRILSGDSSTQPPSPPPSPPGVIPQNQNSRVYFGTRDNIRETTAANAGFQPGQAPHNFALNQILGLLSSSNDVTHGNQVVVTSMTRPGSTGKHGQGLAMDLAFPGLGTDGSAWAAMAERIRTKLRESNISVNDDYTGADIGVVDEGPTGKRPQGWTGNHIHLQFKDATAAEAFRTWYSGKFNTGSQGGPNQQGYLSYPGNQNRALAQADPSVTTVAAASSTATPPVPTSSVTPSPSVISSNNMVMVSLDDTSSDGLARKIGEKITTDLGGYVERIASVLERNAHAG